jgi:uncharacterized metal-binding protein
MPNGRTHDFITLATGAAMMPAALNLALPDMNTTNAFVLVAAHISSGLMFSPDLDLLSTPYRRWGSMRWVWLPYRRMVPHRSWISHSFVLGPLLRVTYFAGIMSLLALMGLGVLNLLVPVDPTGTLFAIAQWILDWIRGHPATIFYALMGFILGGAVHSLADIFVTGLRRRF